MFTASGVLGTIGYPDTVDDLAVDDSGNMYIASANATPPPGGSPAPLGKVLLTKYGFESTTPLASYTVTGVNPDLVSVSGSGRLVYASFGSNYLYEYVDVWEAGKTGAPSFTITIPGSTTCENFVVPFMEHNGTLIVPAHNATTGALSYGVYPAGSSTPSTTINESIVATTNQCAFNTNYLAVSPDGNTLYVTEFSFNPLDTLAGLYVYPLNGGMETYVATPSDSTNTVQPGPAPGAIDTDASGNVYIANDNDTYSPTGGANTPDTLHELSIYGPGGTGTPRIVNMQYAVGSIIVDSGNATTFLSDYAGYTPAPPAGSGISVLPSGASSVTLLPTLTGAFDIALYSGTAARNILSLGGGGSAHGGSHGLAPVRHQLARAHRR